MASYCPATTKVGQGLGEYICLFMALPNKATVGQPEEFKPFFPQQTIQLVCENRLMMFLGPHWVQTHLSVSLSAGQHWLSVFVHIKILKHKNVTTLHQLTYDQANNNSINQAMDLAINRSIDRSIDGWMNDPPLAGLNNRKFSTKQQQQYPEKAR